MSNMPCTGRTPGSLGRSTSPWTCGRMKCIEKVIDHAITGRTRYHARNVRGMDGREIVDTATTGAVRENCRLECGLSVLALDIESLSRPCRLATSTCTYARTVYVRYTRDVCTIMSPSRRVASVDPRTRVRRISGQHSARLFHV